MSCPFDACEWAIQHGADEWVADAFAEFCRERVTGSGPGVWGAAWVAYWQLSDQPGWPARFVASNRRTSDQRHEWNLESQHGWGVCDHACCQDCAAPGDVVVPASECREGRS